ncbi:UPF0102 domain-containing protein [Campylobacter blaseri]|uniref:UPF0102 protein CQ405_03795 n=1 Tax=Campylobacter blaseri TaxID=2042961 RepID=A0A2P8R112_9BACT|nr:YraN family protein [Campylobacter blaseri]PSM52186.1 hypothetical protein CQ405_03795 [Campylobacter blaseri]PSM53952.1 hypothetical protein CRN67_03795 [Campylobacter blaseri]QKF85389.1 UPF0102 domain-containing protein [Campylobacter blaseri]
MGLKEYIFGYKGEDRAVKYLENIGFEIIKRNFRSKFGEIDIIATKDNILHFIEVKSTKGDYEAIYRVTPTKIDKILKTIRFYLSKTKNSQDYQLDIVIVNGVKVEFIRNITI